MAYDKSKMSGGGKFMDNGKGMCSSPDNPMKQPSRVSSEFGPGMNADQAKANRLLKQAAAKNESLRGKSGM
jgi:hypothetical protein